MMDRKSKRKKRLRSKFMIIFIALCMMLVFTSQVIFAGYDAGALLSAFFNHKADLAMAEIDQALKTETDIQKEHLRNVISQNLEASSIELDNFTEEQKKLRVDGIREYANNILSGMSFSNEEDKKQILAKLEEIISSSEQAINSLASSYKPPNPQYVPRMVSDLSTVTMPAAIATTESSIPNEEVQVPITTPAAIVKIPEAIPVVNPIEGIPQEPSPTVIVPTPEVTPAVSPIEVIPQEPSPTVIVSTPESTPEVNPIEVIPQEPSPTVIVPIPEATPAVNPIEVTSQEPSLVISTDSAISIH